MYNVSLSDEMFWERLAMCGRATRFACRGSGGLLFAARPRIPFICASSWRQMRRIHGVLTGSFFLFLLRTPAYIVAGPWPLLAATSLRRSSDDQMIPFKFCVVRVMAPSASFWMMSPSVVLDNGTLELPWSFQIQRSVRRNGYLALSNFPVSGSVLD